MSDEKKEKQRRGSARRVREDRDAERALIQTGRAWQSLVGALSRLSKDGVDVHRITVKGAWHGHDEFLIILAAETENEAIVAFHRADDAGTLWAGLASRIRNGNLKWRTDEYA